LGDFSKATGWEKPPETNRRHYLRAVSLKAFPAWPLAPTGVDASQRFTFVFAIDTFRCGAGRQV